MRCKSLCMKTLQSAGLALLGLLFIGLIAPERIRIPVAGASTKDWNAQ